MKRQFNKGDVIRICENGVPTSFSTNLDKDRELEVGEIFTWNPFKDSRNGIQMKVLRNEFPLEVEEIEE